MDLSKLTPQRLKALKKSLYRQRALHFSICECCNEMQVHNEEGYAEVTKEINRVSKQQSENSK